MEHAPRFERLGGREGLHALMKTIVAKPTACTRLLAASLLVLTVGCGSSSPAEVPPATTPAPTTTTAAATTTTTTAVPGQPASTTKPAPGQPATTTKPATVSVLPPTTAVPGRPATTTTPAPGQPETTIPLDTTAPRGGNVDAPPNNLCGIRGLPPCPAPTTTQKPCRGGVCSAPTTTQKPCIKCPAPTTTLPRR